MNDSATLSARPVPIVDPETSDRRVSSSKKDLRAATRKMSPELRRRYLRLASAPAEPRPCPQWQGVDQADAATPAPVSAFCPEVQGAFRAHLSDMMACAGSAAASVEDVCAGQDRLDLGSTPWGELGDSSYASEDVARALRAASTSAVVARQLYIDALRAERDAQRARLRARSVALMNVRAVLDARQAMLDAVLSSPQASARRPSPLVAARLSDVREELAAARDRVDDQEYLLRRDCAALERQACADEDDWVLSVSALEAALQVQCDDVFGCSRHDADATE